VRNAFTVFLLFGATPAHKPERPSEPWLKGVHLKQAEWEEDAKPPKGVNKKEGLHYAFWRNAIRRTQLGGFGTNPSGEQWIQKKVFSPVSIKNVLRVERLESLLHTGGGPEPEFLAHGLRVQLRRPAVGQSL